MQTLRRNQQKVYYCTYLGETPVIDSLGHDTGERIASYSDPVEMWANVSPASGAVAQEMFGTLDGYDRVLVSDLTECPIDETSVLYIDKEPPTAADAPVAYDYIVRRVAKSLNILAVAVRKVRVE